MSDPYLGTIVNAFSEWSGLDEETSGVQVSVSPLRALLAELGCSSLAELSRRVRGGERAQVLSRLADVLGNRRTGFFRDPEAFQGLARFALPTILQESGERPLRIWVAACGIGPEAYSVAMTVHAETSDERRRRIRILATDVSPQAIDRVRVGCYAPAEIGRSLPEALALAYLVRGEAGWQVVNPVRELVDPIVHNLVDPLPEPPSIELIVVRDLLRHLLAEHRQLVLRRIGQNLAPNGLLWVGRDDPVAEWDSSFEAVPDWPMFYVRVDRGWPRAA